MDTRSARTGLGARVGGLLDEDGLLIVALATFTIVFLVTLRRGLVGDGWLAIVAGRWIVQHGLPSHDALTVMTHGSRWTDQQWLAQLGLYGLWRAGGVKLALLVHAFLAIGTLSAAAVFARRHGATALSVTWVTIPVLLAYYPVAAEIRTQSFALPLFMATLWLLLDDARRPSRRVFLTFPLLVLWANVHGSVVVGAGLVALAGVVGMARARRLSARGLALTVLPWACMLASPYATQLPAYYTKVLVGGDFSSLITEWAPTTLQLVTLPVFILVLGGLWLFGRNGRSVPVFDQLAFLAMAVIAFQAIRNMVWFALIALAVLPPLVDRLRAPVDEPRRLNRILALSLICLTALALGGVAAKSTSWFTHAFPAPAAQAVARAAGPDGRIFATSSYPDWLLWSEPQLAGRVAFDSRAELLKRSQLEEIVRIQNAAGDWRAAIRNYRVFVLDPRLDRTFEHALRRSLGLRVAFRSPQVVVLRRG
ncbi:MAG TPA: hypothetical protein VGH79_10510 [Gaiellaceae bacterium]